MYDIIVIGAGPAGFSAAVYAGRANLKTLLIGDSQESPVAEAQNIGNLLASDGITGKEFIERCMKQAKHYNCEHLNKEAIYIKKNQAGFIVKTNDGKIYNTKSVVVATGISYLESGIEGEKNFIGKGVHYCVACDGYFYKSKRVAIVGEKDFAAEEALELLAYTRDITIFSQGKEFQISQQLMDLLKENKVKMSTEIIAKFYGERILGHLIMESGKLENFHGVFIAMGTTSAFAFANKLGLEVKDGYIVVDKNGKTNVDGVYAAGSCTGGYDQIAKSAGEGCNAAISIIKSLTGKSSYVDQT